MSSRELDNALDDLFQQALRPFTEVQAPPRVWWRVWCAVRVMPKSRWSKFLTRMRGYRTLSHLPSLSSQPYYLEPGGCYRPSPLVGIMVKHMLDLRLAF